MPRLIDTHAHLNFAEFDADRGQVIEKSLQEGIFLINAGVNFQSSKFAVEIAQKYKTGVWAAIGLHPQNIGLKVAKDENGQEPDFDAGVYYELAQSSGKIIAIGEIGLDYLGLPKNEAKANLIKQKQSDVFVKQLDLAKKLGLPIIIHSRLAHQDLINILKEQPGSVNGVIHCFTGNISQMADYRDLGLYFGLNGIIFKLNLDEAIRQMPLDKILLETDCPFLAPPGTPKRNVPQNVKLIAQRVAQIRGESADLLAQITAQTAQSLFGI